MAAFDVVEPQGAGDRVQDGLGEVQGAALLQPDVVVDADAREPGQFLAAQAGDAAPAAKVVTLRADRMDGVVPLVPGRARQARSVITFSEVTNAKSDVSPWSSPPRHT